MSYREKLFEVAKKGRERIAKTHAAAVEKFIKNECEANAFCGRVNALVSIGAILEDKTFLTEEEIIEFANRTNLDYEVYPSENSVKLGFDILPDTTTQEE